MSADQLDSMSDRELDAEWAQAIGFRWYANTVRNCCFLKLPETEFMNAGEMRDGETLPRAHDWDRLVPRFCASADSVVPWLEKHGPEAHLHGNHIWWIRLSMRGGFVEAEAPTFARAAVLALLRSKRAKA